MYRLEMRSTENWDDVRYRDYTSSEARAEHFKKTPKIRFTDSGHGIVPHVTEVRSRKNDKISWLSSHVKDHFASFSTGKRKRAADEIDALRKERDALRARVEVLEGVLGPLAYHPAHKESAMGRRARAALEGKE